MKKAREFRKEARQVLEGGIFGSKFLYALLAILIVTLVEALVTATVVGSIITIVASGPIACGLISVLLRIVRKEDEKADMNHLIDGFKNHFGDSFVSSLLVTIYTFLWTLLLIIPGMIKTYSYSATLYLVNERGLEGNAAITESRRLMKGKKWKLFCLDLSFIGWYLLGLLCLGVGVIWAQTYHEVARTVFFNDLLNEVEVVDVK